MAIVNGVSRIGYMKGGRSALWRDEEMADTFTREAVAFIRRHRPGPFFLYFATHDIHVPRVPHPRFAGKSGMGPRGDAIVEFDWSVGEVLRALDETGVAGDTLVLLTSDNGPVVDNGYRDGAVEELGGHRPAGPYRGGKYSTFEAGTRVPFVVRWPGRVRPGTSRAGQLGRSPGELRGPGRRTRARRIGPRQPRPPGRAAGRRPGRPRVVDRGRRRAGRAPREVEVHPRLGRPEEAGVHRHRARQRSLATALRPRCRPRRNRNVAGDHPEVVAQLRRGLDGR